MKLFQTNQNLKLDSSASLALETPLGICLCEYQIQGKSILSPIRMERTEKGDFLLTWEDSFCRMECLRVSFQPVLPGDMYVDKCFAFIWRIEVKNKASVSWKCCLAPSLEGSCETGEGLISCVFEEKNITFSIGTEDEEKLACRAEKKMWMPNRLKDLITEKNVLCLTNGLEICFDQLLPGDHIQTHFFIAWSSAAKRTISTWTAVDQSCDSLLRQAGFF